MYKSKRYDVQAKRRNTDEPWTEWTRTDDYRNAVNHACHVEELGYSAQIVVQEKQIEELWDILGKNEYEKADAIFNAGFRKQDMVAREIFEEIEKVIGKKYDYYVFDNLDIEGIEQDAIIAFVDAMQKHFTKLKKKYTEVDDG